MDEVSRITRIISDALKAQGVQFVSHPGGGIFHLPFSVDGGYRHAQVAYGLSNGVAFELTLEVKE